MSGHLLATGPLFRRFGCQSVRRSSDQTGFLQAASSLVLPWRGGAEQVARRRYPTSMRLHATSCVNGHMHVHLHCSTSWTSSIMSTPASAHLVVALPTGSALVLLAQPHAPPFPRTQLERCTCAHRRDLPSPLQSSPPSQLVVVCIKTRLN